LFQRSSGGIIDLDMLKWILLLSLVAALAGCSTPLPEECCTVTLVADGQSETFVTGGLTVRDVLLAAGVTLDVDDRVVPVEPTLIEEGMTIEVLRVAVTTEVEQHELPFERRIVRDTSIPEGETRLLEPGIAGVEELTYRITTENGVEVERRFVQRATVVEPRTEVVLLGAQVDVRPVPITGTIAYVANRDGWVIQRTSRNQQRVTSTGDLDGRVFALSPGGRYLLYTRVATRSVPVATEETGEEQGAAFNTLWMVALGNVIADPIPLETENVLWADWAPDCRGELTGRDCRIAYSTGTPVEGNPNWRAENDLWIAWPRGEDGELLSLRRVVDGSVGGAYGWWGTTYAWSPDGQDLAYARADEIGVVRVYNGAQTVLSRFAPYRTYAAWVWTPTVSWSPEGRFIVTTLHGDQPTGGEPEDSPVFDVWLLSANGTITAELSSEVGMWSAPVYAPRGDGIVFGRARSPYVSQTSGYDLYVMDRDGSDRRQVFPASDELGLEYPEVAWGPDGDRVIVVYQGNLNLVSIADGAAQPLTNQGNAASVRWQW
jgi:hypothetical protein